MRMSIALFSLLTALAFSTPSSAQVLTVKQVTSECPDVARAQACSPLATQFLADRKSGRGTDREIVALVAAISEAAQGANVSPQACLDAADGIRILATGASTAEQTRQISDIADALCSGNRIASTGRPGSNDFVVPQSLIEQSSGGAPAPVQVAVIEEEEEEGEWEELFTEVGNDDFDQCGGGVCVECISSGDEEGPLCSN